MICLVANKWLVSRGMSHHPSKEHCVIIYLAVMDKRICLDRFFFGLWHHCLVHLRMLGGLASGIVIHICFATADLLPCRIQHLNCYTACTWIPTIMNLPFKTIEMNDELHKTSNHRNQCNEDADQCCFMLWRNPQCSFTDINTVIIHNLTGNSHYTTYFMFNLCFWVCFRSKNSCDVWGLKWNQCLRVLSYSFGHVKFSLSVHRNTCFVRLLTGKYSTRGWTPLLIWQTELYHNVRRCIQKYDVFSTWMSG